jgi:integrase
MINNTAGGRYRVRVKQHGAVVADQTFPRKRDAERWETEQQGLLNAKHFISPVHSRKSLNELFDMWMPIRESAVAVRTLDSDRSAWRVHIKPRFGSSGIGDISSLEVKTFIATLAKDRRPGTVRRVLATLAALLEFGQSCGYLNTNVASDMTIASGTAFAVSAFSNSELADTHARQRLISPLADVTLFLGLTGLRWGECIALRPCDVIQTPNAGWMLSIQRSVVRRGGGGKPFVKSPKSGVGRLVPLSSQALAIAREWSTGKGLSELIFPGRHGSYLDPKSFRAQVAWATTVPAGFRIHDLRHTCATNMIRAGADVLSVQGTLGHSSSATTLKFYAHVMGADHLRAGMNRLEQAYEEAVRQGTGDEMGTSEPSPIRLPLG